MRRFSGRRQGARGRGATSSRRYPRASICPSRGAPRIARLQATVKRAAAGRGRPPATGAGGLKGAGARGAERARPCGARPPRRLSPLAAQALFVDNKAGSLCAVTSGPGCLNASAAAGAQLRAGGARRAGSACETTAAHAGRRAFVTVQVPYPPVYDRGSARRGIAPPPRQRRRRATPPLRVRSRRPCDAIACGAAGAVGPPRAPPPASWRWCLWPPPVPTAAVCAPVDPPPSHRRASK
ncbi:MAG: hypothetical protein J3K34DRAFT_437510 [Monoraphidium minutum]|nr:MAG: hypothetical protein J3K34DRAFT_437510 [Monoraphidium minutum]